MPKKQDTTLRTALTMPLSEFVLFPKLPLELRQKVYNTTEPRDGHLLTFIPPKENENGTYTNASTDKYAVATHYQPFLLTSKETKDYYCKVFKDNATGFPAHLQKPIHFDPSKDVVLFNTIDDAKRFVEIEVNYRSLRAQNTQYLAIKGREFGENVFPKLYQIIRNFGTLKKAFMVIDYSVLDAQRLETDIQKELIRKFDANVIQWDAQEALNGSRAQRWLVPKIQYVFMEELRIDVSEYHFELYAQGTEKEVEKKRNGLQSRRNTGSEYRKYRSSYIAGGGHFLGGF